VPKLWVTPTLLPSVSETMVASPLMTVFRQGQGGVVGDFELPAVHVEDNVAVGPPSALMLVPPEL